MQNSVYGADFINIPLFKNTAVPLEKPLSHSILFKPSSKYIYYVQKGTMGILATGLAIRALVTNTNLV